MIRVTVIVDEKHYIRRVAEEAIYEELIDKDGLPTQVAKLGPEELSVHLSVAVAERLCGTLKDKLEAALARNGLRLDG